MYNFFPQLIIILSVAGILVIIIRKIPVLSKEEMAWEQEEIILKRRWVFLQQRLNYSIKKLRRNIEILKQKKYFKSFLGFLEKTLRKIRVLSLKIDNKISGWIEKLKRAQDIAEEKKWIKIIANDSQNIEAYKKLGEFYFQRKDYEKAKESFKKVLSLNSHDEEARERLKELERLKEHLPM